MNANYALEYDDNMTDPGKNFKDDNLSDYNMQHESSHDSILTSKANHLKQKLKEVNYDLRNVKE